MLLPMRRFLLAILLLLVLTTSAQADGDPASDVLVFKAYFLPYAPQTPAAAEEKLNVVTAAVDRAGYPIRVAVIAGTGDLGIVPQYLGKPQEYAPFLAEELKFAYKGGVLIVMSTGYGLAGIDDKAVTAKLATLPKPASNDPADLATAGADAVVALATAAGKTLDLTAPAPENTAQTTAVHNAAAANGGGGSNSSAIVLIAGGSAGLLVALGGLFWWARRAPEDDPTPDAG
jgi:hypothetical protein